jgi:asparagine synthase (glutamine-hydrolysing)
MGAAEKVSAFVGIVSFDGAPIDAEREAIVGRAASAPRQGRASTRRLEGAVFAQSPGFAASGPSRDSPLLTSRNGRSLFAASARLDNREELAAALELAPSELARIPDPLLILRAIERWGEPGIARILGAFAFALWDADARRLTLGRDCLGNRALFYHVRPGAAVFATTLTALFAFPDVPRTIDELTLADFMAAHMGDPRRTFYHGIERVPSRTVVTIDGSGVRHRHYWAPDLDAPPPCGNEDDDIARARELLDRAVEAAIRDSSHVAISTSGGFDSSAIAATAARVGGAHKITCYVGVPPPGMQIHLGPLQYLDERDKVEALVRMHPALEARFIAPERPHPLEEDCTRLFARTNLPVLGASNLGWFAHLYDAVAQARHRALLVGLAGNFGLTWSGDLSLVARLRTGEWGGFAGELRATARQSGRGLARTFAGDVIMPAAPAPLRRLLHRLRGRDPDAVERFSALNPAFIAENKLVQRWRSQEFDPWFEPRTSRPARLRAYRLFDDNQLGRDLRAMCHATHGFEMRDPLADRRLLEFVLAVPEPMFRSNGVPRSFARRVLADRLPREILDERRRGVQAPTWFRSLDSRRTDIAIEVERCETSALARRLIDIPRLKRLVAQWPKDEQAAQERQLDYRVALARAVLVGRFVRWVEGGNA